MHERVAGKPRGGGGLLVGGSGLTRGCSRQRLQWVFILQLLLQLLGNDTLHTWPRMPCSRVSKTRAALSLSPFCTGNLTALGIGLGLEMRRSVVGIMRLRKPQWQLQGLLGRVKGGGGGEGCAGASMQSWEVCIQMGAGRH